MSAWHNDRTQIVGTKEDCGHTGKFFSLLWVEGGEYRIPQAEKALRALTVRMGEASCVKRKVVRRGRRKKVEEKEEENGKGEQKGSKREQKGKREDRK